MGKIITLNHGEKLLITKDIKDLDGLDSPFIGDYFKTVAQAQMDNCGYYILDPETRYVEDNEYTLNDAYEKIKKMKL